MMKKIGLALLLCATSLFGGSLRLYNDSPYKLRVSIRASDGTYLGEMVILPDHTVTWSSDYSSFGASGQQYGENPSRSLTPYSVSWSCLDGGSFGVNLNQPTGGLASASSSSGPKYCKPPKKKKKSTAPTAPYGANEDDEQLQDADPNAEPPSQ